MSVNRYLPHIFVLPEDDANRQLANGFLLQLSTRQIQVLPEAGGWANVLARFLSDHLVGMSKYPDRFMILLIDFDGDNNRLANVKASIPPHLSNRVFVLGTSSEPEALRQAGLGFYEVIGMTLAEDCRDDGAYTTWNHPLLQNNAAELSRLRLHVRPILFNAPLPSGQQA